MVSLTETVEEWKDFPQGLSVLIVDEDRIFLDSIKAKLQRYKYNVTAFSKGDEALSALANDQFLFHVVLVEAATTDIVDGYKILQASKELPTIMMSNMTSMAIMMKCFALGAVDVFQKPLSDEKLRNIWQHVVRKVFSVRDALLPEPLKPVKAIVESVLQICPLQGPDKSKRQEEYENNVKGSGSGSNILTQSCLLKELAACERFCAPSTPQLEQGARMTRQEEALDECPTSTELLKSEKDDVLDSRFHHTKQEGISQDFPWTTKTDDCMRFKLEIGKPNKVHLDCAVDNKPCDGVALASEKKDVLSVLGTVDSVGTSDLGMKGPSQHVECCDSGSGNHEAMLSDLGNIDACGTTDLGMEVPKSVECGDSGSGNEEALLQTDFSRINEVSVNAETVAVERSETVEESKEDRRGKSDDAESGGRGSKSSMSGKKKMKVGWTPDLHRRFVQAVELLGVDQAIPSRILEVMKVEGLTRHNIASHLQKYRSHRKHLLSRDAETCSLHPNKHLSLPGWATQEGNAWFASHQGNRRIQPRPLLILPAIQVYLPSHGQQIAPPLHVWGQPTLATPNIPNTWQSPDHSAWQHPGVCADSWGHPAPFSGASYYPHPTLKPFAGPESVPLALAGEGQMLASNAEDPNRRVTVEAAAHDKLLDFYPPKELLDAAISEALSNPLTPLPLGLKPPSMESVMTELQRQGINTVHSRTATSHTF